MISQHLYSLLCRAGRIDDVHDDFGSVGEKVDPFNTLFGCHLCDRIVGMRSLKQGEHEPFPRPLFRLQPSSLNLRCDALAKRFGRPQLTNPATSL